MRKQLLLIGTMSYLAMIVMAVILFKERITLLDGSFILFKLLSEGDLAIQVYRFGSAATQIFPLMASWMDFPLVSVMKIYSACFPIYFFVLFLICLLFLKKEKYAILLLLFNVGMVTHTFYWVIPEFQQGLSLLIVYFAFLEMGNEKGWNTKVLFWISNIFLLATLAFFHPLMIFPFMFFTGYLLLTSGLHFMGISIRFNIPKLETQSNSPANHNNQFLISGLLFLFFFLIKTFLLKTPYDSHSMGGLKNFISLFPNYFTIPSNINFLNYLLKDYYLLILAGIIILTYCIKNKSYAQLIFIFGSFLGYLALINVSYPNGPEQFYIESLYLPLSLMVFFPLVDYVFRTLPKKILLMGLCAVIFIRLFHIFNTHHLYTDRVSYISQFLEETKNHENKKLIVAADQLDENKLLMTWGFSYECWLISTIETGETRSVVAKENPSELNWALGKNKSFITKWGLFDYKDLPEQYFVFRDTSNYIIYPNPNNNPGK
jgi:hypothetical protein